MTANTVFSLTKRCIHELGCEQNSSNVFAGVNHLNDKIEDFRLKQEAAGIQSSSVTTALYMTLQISELLITPEGKVAVSLIPKIIEYLNETAYQGNGVKPDFMIWIEYVLNQLKNPNNDLIDKIESLQAPQQNAAFSRVNLLINSTLWKEKDYQPTKRDARVVLLKYLIDAPRQDATLTQKAEQLLIAVHRLKMEMSLDDCINLLQTGCCNRVTSHDVAVFNTFASFMTCTSINNPLSINQQGKITNPDHRFFIKFFEALPIQAGLRQMGIPCDNADLNKQVLDEILKGKESAITTPEKIFATYIAIWKMTNTNENQEELLPYGIYGFAALANNPAQRAMISIMLSMPQNFTHEVPSNLLPTTWVIDSIVNTFLAKLKPQDSLVSWLIPSWFISSSNATDLTIDKVGESFKKTLNFLTQVEFEQTDTIEHRGVYGTYRLYQKTCNPEMAIGNIGLRISSGKMFQEFTQKAINYTKINASLTNQPQEVIDVLNKMYAYTKEDQFINDSIKSFQDLPLKTAFWPPLASEQKTPWNFGYQPPQEMICDVWLGTQEDVSLVTSLEKQHSNDAFVAWVFNHVIEIDSLDLHHTAGLYQGSASSWLIDQGFNWMTDHSSVLKIKSYMDENKATWQEAIDELVAKPGLEVANTVIDIVQLQAKLSALFKENQKSDAYLLPSLTDVLADACKKTSQEMSQTCLPEIFTVIEKEFEKKEPTVHSVSSKILQLMEEKVNPNKNQKISNVLEFFVTQGVLSQLSEENYKKIVENAIHVADSNFASASKNWQRNDHYCFFYSPVTLDYSFGMVTNHSDDFFFPLIIYLDQVVAVKRNLKDSK